MTDGTIGSVLRRQVADRGGMTMLVCDDDRLTYSDAETRSRALALGLVALGANRGTHVGILFPTGVDFVVELARGDARRCGRGADQHLLDRATNFVVCSPPPTSTCC